jgi:Tol biopolymer transport system component
MLFRKSNARRDKVCRLVAISLLGMMLFGCHPKNAIGIGKSDIGSTVIAKAVCRGQPICQGKSPLIESIRLLQAHGTRARWSPQGTRVVFDRINANGYYAVYLSDTKGRIVASLTNGKPGLPNKNNGNPTFDHSGRFVIFISEKQNHFLDTIPAMGDPGIGLYSDIWATDLQTGRFFQLTHYPVKKGFLDRTPSFAVVNPHFTHDGRNLVWTERYKAGGTNNWGKWRIRIADFSVTEKGVPHISAPRVLYTPAKGTYVTSMGQEGDGAFIFAGNLDGQHEYGMDQYRWEPATGHLTNLTSTPTVWEEGSSLAHSGTIVYMSNIDSKYQFNANRNWMTQPMQRDLYLMNKDGRGKERLTFFNTQGAPENIDKITMVTQNDVSPDGKHIVANIGVDIGTGRKRKMHLGIILITLRNPL